MTDADKKRLELWIKGCCELDADQLTKLAAHARTIMTAIENAAPCNAVGLPELLIDGLRYRYLSIKGSR